MNGPNLWDVGEVQFSLNYVSHKTLLGMRDSRYNYLPVLQS